MQTPINDRTEERLLAEIEELKRKLHQQNRDASGHGKGRRPSAATLWMLGIAAVLILVGAFFAGYLPQASRQTALAKEAREDTVARRKAS
jgi:hypothetical protein